MPIRGFKAAVSKVMYASRQRCRLHFTRNVIADAGKSGRRVLSAFIAIAFAPDTPEAANDRGTAWQTRCGQRYRNSPLGWGRTRRASLHNTPEGTPRQVALHN